MRVVATLDNVHDVRMMQANVRVRSVLAGSYGRVTAGGDREGIE